MILVGCPLFFIFLRGFQMKKYSTIFNRHRNFGKVMLSKIDTEDIVTAFNLDAEDSPSYRFAYSNAYAVAVPVATAVHGKPEEYIDKEEVIEQAHKYALSLAKSYKNGNENTPKNVINWACSKYKKVN